MLRVAFALYCTSFGVSGHLCVPLVLPGFQVHVIAARITAENTDSGFTPTSGAVSELNFRSTPSVWGYFSVDSSGRVHEFAGAFDKTALCSPVSELVDVRSALAGVCLTADPMGCLLWWGSRVLRLPNRALVQLGPTPGGGPSKHGTSIKSTVSHALRV
jgi:hypothetical protein